MDWTNLGIVGGAALALGYVMLRIVIFLLPQRLRHDDSKQTKDMLKDAQKQAERLRQTELERSEDKIQTLREELEEDITSAKEDLEIAKKDIEAQERTLQLEENRIKKVENDFNNKKSRVGNVLKTLETKKEELSQINVELVQKLEATAGQPADKVKENLQSNLIEERQIEAQRLLKTMDEDLQINAKKLAERMMARTISRYYPDFYWPKMVNHVEVGNKRLLDDLSKDECTLLAEIKEKAEIEVELLEGDDHNIPIVKLAGGAGINREATRMALTELFTKSRNAWHKAAQIYDKHRATLEKQAEKLGEMACDEIQLEGIHPEIQRLVGYLNWRTSYRQNQWHHTVEVARLAGILAHEVGVDPDQAKRCGMLHDIGKALDYRIDGSHAVISGDYADRFGESRLICDTVMSHHNDLIVETPLSYVLKTADTLSGARPGARVNLEEGYQVRLSGIEGAVRSFPGVTNVAIMNGAREVHVEVNYKKVKESELQALSTNIAKKITEEVAFPGEIKVLVSRIFEATAVA